MRTDSNVSRLSFRHSQQWRTDPFANQRVPQIDRRLEGTDQVDGKLVVHSLSGRERNHLFLNRGGKQFDDVSLISGVDTPADSRAFVTLDFDHDGQLDIGLVNANNPLLNLYRNQIGHFNQASAKNNFLALRFVGGSNQATAGKLSCRDGYGAMVELTLSNESVIKREHRCGEGFGTQNSNTMIIGLGNHKRIASLQVRWPSGRQQRFDSLKPNQLITLYEVPERSGTEKGYRAAAYESLGITADQIARRAHERRELRQFRPQKLIVRGEELPPTGENFRLYLTTATWCTACVEHIPAVAAMMEQYESLEVIGLPIDAEETAEQLQRFAQAIAAPYLIVEPLTVNQRQHLREVFAGVLPYDAVPAAILVDDRGRVLLTTAGLPSRSDLRRLINSPDDSPQ